MGAQIALHCAAHGYPVQLFSRSAATLQRAAQSHAQELEHRLAGQHITVDEKESILRRIQCTTQMPEAVAGADLVIENVPEQLEIKREVFAQLDQLCPRSTVLATDSSSICVSALEAVTQRPEQVLNMHFYSPVWQRSMVELMGGTATTKATMERARRFVRSLGLTPLLVRKESTGFLFNRVWRAIKKECLHLVDEGVASYEDVDRAWILAFGTPVWPLWAHGYDWAGCGAGYRTGLLPGIRRRVRCPAAPPLRQDCTGRARLQNGPRFLQLSPSGLPNAGLAEG